MPRTPRIDYPGARHHVMNRGARRQVVFRHSLDRQRFLNLVGQLPERFDVRVHGYAVLPNHYHLMVEAPKGNLSVAMQHLGAMYTQWTNQTEGWDGPVFRGRFRNRVVETTAYWTHLLAYLHLNPARAGLSDSAQDGPWTSHDAYVGAVEPPRWLETEELLGLHGGASQLQAYVEATLRGEVAPPQFDPAELWNGPVSAAVKPPTLKSPSIADGLDKLSAVLRVERGDVEPPSLGELDKTRRAVTLWWLSRACDCSIRDLARMYRVGTTTVHRRIADAEQLRFRHRGAATWIEALRGAAPG